MANTTYAAQTTTHVSTEMIEQAIAVCKAYSTACDQNFAALEQQITALKANSAFIGDASDGYDVFFQEVKPLLTTNLTDLSNPESLMSGVIAVLEIVRSTINHQQDPALGQANQTVMADTGSTASAQ